MVDVPLRTSVFFEVTMKVFFVDPGKIQTIQTQIVLAVSHGLLSATVNIT